MPNHYETLGIGPFADAEQIRIAAERRRGQIPEDQRVAAVTVLGDPEQRAAYDAGIGVRQQVSADDQIRMAFQTHMWAGFWRRWCASVIDGLILYFPAAIPAGIAFAVIFAAGGANPSPVVLGTAVAVALAIYFCVGGAYQGWLIGTPSMATWGRSAVGVAIIDQATGMRVTGSRAMARGFLSALFLILWPLELVQLFTTKRQSLADLIIGTVAIRKGSASAMVVVLIAIPVVGIPVLGVLAAIAIPAYQDYTIRARFSGALSAAAQLKTQVAENAFAGRPDLSEGIQPIGATPRMPASIVVDRDGAIEISMRTPARQVGLRLTPHLSAANGPTVVPGSATAGPIFWQCTVEKASDDRWVPPDCRI